MIQLQTIINIHFHYSCYSSFLLEFLIYTFLQEIQENLLPPPVHIYPKKKKARSSEHLGANARINQQTENQEGSSSLNSPIVESQRVDRDGINNCKKSMPDVQVSRRSFSPYPNVWSSCLFSLLFEIYNCDGYV